MQRPVPPYDPVCDPEPVDRRLVVALEVRCLLVLLVAVLIVVVVVVVVIAQREGVKEGVQLVVVEGYIVVVVLDIS